MGSYQKEKGNHRDLNKKKWKVTAKNGCKLVKFKGKYDLKYYSDFCELHIPQ